MVNKKRVHFETFKSNICHYLKNLGDVEFIKTYIADDWVRYYYDLEYLPECFYILAMLEYLCRVNNIAMTDKYDDIRQYKLSDLAFPQGVKTVFIITGDENVKEEAIKKAIPEFLKYNIVEWGIRDVA